MTTPVQTRSLRWVIRSQYFLYFGVLGIFLPFFNLYCHRIGFSGMQIGVLSALRSVVSVVFPLVWGILADRYDCRRPIFIFCQFASMALWGLFLFTTDFHLMLAITVGYGIFFAPLIPFLETFTMEILGARKQAYGKIRAWGSISFILTVLVLGKIVDLFSIRVILYLILAGAFLQALVSLLMPAPSRRKQLTPTFRPGLAARKEALVFFLSAFLMLVSHGTYYGFFSIHLAELGFGGTFIGAAWALASSAEIIMMIRSDVLFKRFSLEKVLLFSFAVAILRWLLLAAVRSPWPILATQLLHAVTYGSFHMASILFIDRLAPDNAKTLGQALNNAVTYGLGMMVGFFVNGFFYETIGAHALFLFSALTALAGGLIFAAGCLRRGRNPSPSAL
ncbi:MAG: MFS transporter [Desulfobacterales bacterium]|jgi:PPP family 3-phenylpropionic acid transporter